MSLLKEKQDKLATVEAKIAELQKTYDDSVAEKQKLERNIATTAGRLKRSSKLTTALADEQVRNGRVLGGKGEEDGELIGRSICKWIDK